MTIPRATMRLQFNPGFTLDDAALLVDYYAALGISHIYASPLETAQPGSMHGYDIVDHGVINPELGGELALRRLVTRLRAVGMGLILDIVPNHMGIAGGANSWWQNVLEWGRESPYAEWFDIDWESENPLLRGKVLMPFLAQPYADAMRAGEIGLRFDETDGRIFAAYKALRLPLDPSDYPIVLRTVGSPRLAATIAAFEQIARVQPAAMDQPKIMRFDQAHRAMAMLKTVSRNPCGMTDIDAALKHFSSQPGQPSSSCEPLHLLLERQHYRLTSWRNAAQEINWRRFFEVTELAGLRVENMAAFNASHALIFRLYAQGLIDGVRIDHIDGLADPANYCRLMRRHLQQLTPLRPAFLTMQAPYIVVEKILAADEALRPGWGMDGTTGYEFMDQVSALFHDGKGAQRLTALWDDWTGTALGFALEVQRARRQLLLHNLASEFNTLARLLYRIVAAGSEMQTMSSDAVSRVLMEILVNFPVYRTYVDAEGGNPLDRQRLAQALARAQQTLAVADHPLLQIIGTRLAAPAPDAEASAAALHAKLIQRFQQITPVLTAKSVEDTAFYRYGRLLSRNEVGSDPGHFCLEVENFHEKCLDRFAHFPHNLLATATHDHKRGEDLRARLAVLSELPDAWRATVLRWHDLRQSIAPAGPQPADELMLYQMLVGAWPHALMPDDAAGIRNFASRIARWQTKALREAKRISSWFDPNLAYETTCEECLYALLNDQCFLTELVTGVGRIAPAGVINSLGQTLLKLTAPGVPDIYQGTELWDFSLVDPDNRQPVDYALRQRMLAMPPIASLARWNSGQLKLHIIQQTLACRKRAEAVFSDGDYVPLMVTGLLAHHVVAFLRRSQRSAALTVVTRLAASALGEATTPLIQAERWGNTAILLPADLNEVAEEWADMLTLKKVGSVGGQLSVARILGDLPVALLFKAHV